MSLQAPKDDKHVDTFDKLNPLAFFQYVPSSPKLLATLRRLNAMLSTYSGVDRSLMLVQVRHLSYGAAHGSKKLT
jgi:hypothetical protein